MIEHLTPDRIANSILQRSRFKGTYLIVEGNSDYALYRKFTSDDFCLVEIAFGNKNVIEVVEELQSRGFHDALGLIDADFRNLDDDLHKNEGVLHSDDHDLEIMIIKSKAFETVLEHHGEKRKIDEFIKANNAELRQILLELSTPLAYLKWANKKNNLGLVFKPHLPNGRLLNYAEFVPCRTLKLISYEKMIETVINYSMPKGKINTTKEDALAKIKLVTDKNPDKYQLCNGHDLCNIICLGLRYKLGSLNANALPPDQLERELILAYDSRYFQETTLYENIKSWEGKRQKKVLNF